MYAHDTLPCGIEYAAATLPDRHVVSFQIRVLAGTCCEPESVLGVGQILDEVISKGTEHFTGRQLADAFDAIGASWTSGVGRETTTFSCTVLPEHFERAVELHAEFLRTPTFPGDAVDVQLSLALQELDAMEDEPQALVDKYISHKAYGPVLGRHALGERETLARIKRDTVVDHWKKHFHAGRMLVSVAGPLPAQQVADAFQQRFSGFGGADHAGRAPVAVQFSAGATHYDKDLEQQQIGICWPGVDAVHDDFPIQQVVLGVLSGGMGARLFTEVREKQGLAYWVSAWQETPRKYGMMFLGASTTPERCDRTYHTLLSEVDRLADDIEPAELQRAITGMVANHVTRGNATRSRCALLANDLFFFGRPVPIEEKLDKIKAVTVKDVQRYLHTYPRDALCVVTLGPKKLAAC